jgi:hypothetical protein
VAGREPVRSPSGRRAAPLGVPESPTAAPATGADHPAHQLRAAGTATHLEENTMSKRGRKKKDRKKKGANHGKRPNS